MSETFPLFRCLWKCLFCRPTHFYSSTTIEFEPPFFLVIFLLPQILEHQPYLLSVHISQVLSLFQSEFYGEVGVGHPAQIFKVIFDTAWASSWIPSITCSQWIIPGCMNHNRYDSTRSGSYQENNTYFKTQMEDGDIIGFLSTDNINVSFRGRQKWSTVEQGEMFCLKLTYL